VDLERELQRVLHTREMPPPVADPVTAVHAGMRRRRRNQRLQVLSAGLGVVAVVVAASLLVGNPLASSSKVVTPTTQLPTPEPTTAPSLTTVPAGFTVGDLTFVSTQQGWALGTAPCASGRCTVQLVTSDGGKTWGQQPESGLPETCAESSCVRQIRFADAQVGYAFGPSLYLTQDGGAHWSRLVSEQVDGLEIAAGTVSRVVSTQPSCAPACNFVVQTTTVGSLDWTTAYTSHEYRVSASIARYGDSIAVPLFANPAGGSGDAHIALLLSTDSGTSWQVRDDPCGPPSSNDPGEVDTRDLSFGPDGSFVTLCNQRMSVPGGSAAVRLSTDTGTTFGPSRATPGLAIRVAAVSKNQVVAEVVADGKDALVLTQDGGRTWTRVAEQPQPAGTTGGSFLAFSTRLTGTWVGVDATSVWRSTDGGATWTEHPFR